MIPVMEQLIALSDRIAKLLHVSRRRRVALHAYLYSYARRLRAFAGARSDDRWKHLLRAWGAGAAQSAARRNSRAEQNGRAPQDFSDPDFKNDWYLRAIAQYIPRGYRGTVHVVWGRDTIENLGDASGGWSELGKKRSTYTTSRAGTFASSTTRKKSARF